VIVGPAPTNSANRTREGPVFFFVQMSLRNFDTARTFDTAFSLRCCRLWSCARAQADLRYVCSNKLGKNTMAWTTPTLVEICIGLEINGYLPAEF
jgi:coenzyme PQQ precursor peptide PqqA